MTRILVIDDEPINHQLVGHALAPLQWEMHFAEDGKTGISQARSLKPDIIITDVMMPDVNGYEVTRILRRELQFSATPILVLTAQSGLEDKLKSFEAGADDHLTKPFDAAELLVRVTALLKRVEAVKASRIDVPVGKQARTIAVHSLRGGTGCSTLAVNLGIGLFSLWREPTILLDLTMTAGQVALMLNMSLKRTWADIARYAAKDLDIDSLSSIISGHESGLHFIAAPTFPSEAETLPPETLGAAMRLIQTQYDYVVADLPHDFSGVAIQALDAADVILMVASPDMASVRALTAALDTYDKLGYGREKIKLVLSAIFPHSSLTKEKIESGVRLPAIATIPYVQDLFVDAINLGQPPLLGKPNAAVSGLLEDFALHLSKDSHKKSKPENPTETWKRVYKRYQQRKK
ncbi:MAG: AAA family ATPase [Anaerolineales bacterium]